MARPQGMISVAEFSSKYGEDVASAIHKVRDGTYEGKEVSGEFYLVVPLSAHRATDNTASGKVASEAGNATEEAPARAYGVGRFLLNLFIFLGWAAIAVCVGYLFLAGGNFSQRMMAGLGGVFSGLVIIQASQVALAVLDTADNTRAIFNELRRQADK